MKNFNFLSNKKIAFIIAGVILLAGLISFIAFGFNMGVDFTGGSKITIQLADKAESNTVNDVEKIAVSEVGEDNFVSAIRSTSNNKTVIVTVKAVDKVKETISEIYGIDVKTLNKEMQTDTNGNQYAYFKFNSSKSVDKQTVKDALNKLGAEGSDIFKDLSVENDTVTVSYYSYSIEDMIVSQVNEKYTVVNADISTISKNRAAAQTKTALIAAAIAIVLMFVYIAFRFKQFASGISSVLCLFFNIFVMFTFYAIFDWELTLDIIPACLTILGYSINATIVIFDRIRENYGKDKADFDTAANDGVHSTMLRSVNTTITTLITIVLVYILGVESIKAFALPLIIGIIAGLFSSVCLSAPLWSVIRNKNKGVKKKAQAE